ncbi:MAG: hypothetical protein AB8B85_11905 [Paracoccaceae bacterium]
MSSRRFKVTAWVAVLGLCLSIAAFGVSILTYLTNAERYSASNTLAMLDKRLNPEIMAAMRNVAGCVRAAGQCEPFDDSETQQSFFVFFGYLESVAFCVQLELCSKEIAANALSGELDAARHLGHWISAARTRFGDADYLKATEQVDLSRFDAAPLIAFIAAKETDYGTETDGRTSR